ncbi:MAG: hypothetical protein ABIF89_02280, partial [bacterium]
AKLGQKICKEETLAVIVKINKALIEEIKIDPVEFTVLKNDRINAKMLEGWNIYFNAAGDIDWQITKLQLVLEKEIPEDKRNNLEYINVRFTKVYYRYQQE